MIHPKENATNKNINNKNDNPIRHVNALTVRSERPLSCMRKYKALPNEKRIKMNMIKTIALVSTAIMMSHKTVFQWRLV